MHIILVYKPVIQYLYNNGSQTHFTNTPPVLCFKY